MSTIDERIQKHKELASRYDKRSGDYRGWAIHYENKAIWHQTAIKNLESKKAKQENKEMR